MGGSEISGPGAADDLIPVQSGCFYVADPERAPDKVAEPPGPAELVSVVPGC